MPPKKRKRKAKTPKSRPTQTQSQRVTINIGKTTKSKPRKYSGRGNLPPPSHAHNLAPTFVTTTQAPIISQPKEEDLRDLIKALHRTQPQRDTPLSIGASPTVPSLPPPPPREPGNLGIGFQPYPSLSADNFEPPEPLTRTGTSFSLPRSVSQRFTEVQRKLTEEPIIETAGEKSAAAEESSVSSSSSSAESEEEGHVTSKLQPSEEHKKRMEANRAAQARFQQQLRDNTPTIIAKIDRGETLTGNELKTIKSKSQSKAGKEAFARYEKRKL
jgi:hypothetical protein